MVVKLPKDTFTAGDMIFSVRRRYRPSIDYLKQFYPTGSMTLEAKDMIKRFNKYKSSDEYILTKIQEAKDKHEETVKQILKDH